MANNYLLFSEQITGLKKREWSWLFQTLDVFKTPLASRQALCDDPEDATMGWPHFEYAFEENNKSLWLYSEESANIYILANIVRAFLAKFRPDDSFTLSYALTCSKPCLSEFGGGAIFVTAKKVEWMNTWGWQSDKAAKFAKMKEKHGKK